MSEGLQQSSPIRNQHVEAAAAAGLNVVINQDGTITCLVNKKTEPFIDLGSPRVRRASYVEPDNRILRLLFAGLRKLFGDKGWMASFTRLWPCLWRVNLGPIGGPILPRKWRNRQQAIDAEVQWLNVHFL